MRERLGVTPEDEPANDEPIADQRRRTPRLDEALVDDVPDEAVEEEMTEIAHETWQSLTGSNGYLPVLLLLICVMMVGPLLGDTYVGSFITLLFSAGTLLLTVFRSTNNPKFRKVATAMASTVTAGAMVAGYVHHRHEVYEVPINEIRWAQIVFTSCYLILLLGALPLVLIRAFGHRRVSLNTVCATISGYLIIGLIFTSIYRVIGGFTQFFVQTPDPSLGEYSYFSFITLTTTGFGDLTAKTDPQRAVVMLEAVLGQIFMVTAVARVVSLLGSVRPEVDRYERETADARSDQT
jgi:hypothetical protein